MSLAQLLICGQFKADLLVRSTNYGNPDSSLCENPQP